MTWNQLASIAISIRRVNGTIPASVYRFLSTYGEVGVSLFRADIPYKCITYVSRVIMSMNMYSTYLFVSVSWFVVDV